MFIPPVLGKRVNPVRLKALYNMYCFKSDKRHAPMVPRAEVEIISIRFNSPRQKARGELGELLYAIAGWVARMESQRRSERTKAGLSRAKAQGKRLGRPPGSKDKRKRMRRQRFTVL